MNLFKKLRFKFNDWKTRKRFTHVDASKVRYYTVAKPDDFYIWSTILNYDVFAMACLQGYVQDELGVWNKMPISPFENHKQLELNGITLIKEKSR